MTYAKIIDNLRSALLDLSVLAERDGFKLLNNTIRLMHQQVDLLRFLTRTHGKND